MHHQHHQNIFMLKFKMKFYMHSVLLGLKQFQLSLIINSQFTLSFNKIKLNFLFAVSASFRNFEKFMYIFSILFLTFVCLSSLPFFFLPFLEGTSYGQQWSFVAEARFKIFIVVGVQKVLKINNYYLFHSRCQSKTTGAEISMSDVKVNILTFRPVILSISTPDIRSGKF